MHDVTKIARDTWLNGPNHDLNESTCLKLYETLQDPSGFNTLINLDFFAKCCWPAITNNQTTCDKSLILSTALIMYADWATVEESNVLTENDSKHSMSIVFQHFLHLSREPCNAHAVLGLCAYFSHLEELSVRLVVGQYLSIGVWSYLPEKARSELIDNTPGLSKVWQKYLKKQQRKANETGGLASNKDSWLHDIITSSLPAISKNNSQAKNSLSFLSALIELLLILVQQLPSRRYLLAYIKSSGVLQSLQKLGSIVKDDILDKHISLLRFYIYFPVDEFTGESLNDQQLWKRYSAKVYAMQQTVFSSDMIKAKIPLLPVSNFAAIPSVLAGFEASEQKEAELEDVVKFLTDGYVNESLDISTKLAWFRQQYTWSPYSYAAGELNYNDAYGPLISEMINRLEHYGTRTFKLRGPLPIPFLGGQFLSAHDFILRMYATEKSAYLTNLRQMLDEILLQGKSSSDVGRLIDITVLEAAPPLIGELHPSFVKIESKALVDDQFVKSSVSKKNHPYAYFLLELEEDNSVKRIVKAKLEAVTPLNRKGKFARGLLDDSDTTNDQLTKANALMTLKIHTDKTEGLNAFIRLEAKQAYNDKVIQKLQSLANSHIKEHNSLPLWLNDCFLGLGGPENELLKDKMLKSIDMRNIFMNAEHLTETLNIPVTTGPPYKLIKENGNLQAVSYVDSTVSAVGVSNNNTRFKKAEIQAVLSALDPGLTMISTSISTADRVNSIFRNMLSLIYFNLADQKTLVVTESEKQLAALFSDLEMLAVDPRHFLRVSSNSPFDESASDSIKKLFKLRESLLEQVCRLAKHLNIPGAHGDSCESSGYFYTTYIAPILNGSDEEAKQNIAKFYTGCSEQVAVHRIEKLFGDVASIRPFELFSRAEQTEYLLKREAKIVGVTSTYFANNVDKFVGDRSYNYQNLIIMEADQIPELHSYLTLRHPDIERVILQGVSKQTSRESISFFHRLLKLNTVPVIEIADLDLYRPDLLNGGTYSGRSFNPGLWHTKQFINVSESEEQGNKVKSNKQNLINISEANYVVLLYQYMRLLGYPKDSITLVGLSSLQVSKIKELIAKRCTNSDINNLIYGEPTISTVEKCATNDYIIVSLTATKSLPANQFNLPRARLGLYIIGKLQACEHSSNKDITNILGSTPDRDLQVVTGELYKTETRTNQRSVPMVGLAHLESYVREMNNQRYAYEKGRKKD